MGKQVNVTKAVKAAKAQTQGVRTRHSKVYTKVNFHRPRTLRAPKAPKAPRTARVRKVLSEFQIIQAPVFTDRSLKQIEKNNVLTFQVHNRSTKQQIKAAIQKLYQAKAVRVNTLIRPDGTKKAYCTLDASVTALDVANRIGIL